MKTYKAGKTVSKGVIESLSVAVAVALVLHVPALEPYKEVAIVVFSALIRAGLNLIKHRFGIDIAKLIERQP